MPRKHRRVLGSRPYCDWSAQALENAISAVKTGALTMREAQDKYKVPKSTIHRKINKLNMGAVGRPTELNYEEEEKLVQGLIILAEWGTPLTTLELRLLVKSYIDAKGQTSRRFKGNMPGVEWCYSFVERHKNKLSQRMCCNIKRARAQISKEDITEYFGNLENSTIGVDPENIINFDETNVSDDPGRKTVLARRGSKRVDRVIDHSKSSTSVMFAGTATGKMLPPYIVYKAEHLHSTWIANGPQDARYNRSRSGWFDGVIFQDWFDTIIVPYFKEIDKARGSPSLKLIIGDNLSSHISLNTIQKCEEHNIRFVLLPPNSTHLCQPLDVAVFKSFKLEWKNVLTEWKLKNRGTVSKDKFPSLLKKALQILGDRMSTNLISGFKASGIYPHNPEAVLKRLPQNPQNPEPSSSGQLWTKTIVDMLQKTRENDRTIKTRRSKLNVKPGQSVNESHFASPSTSRQEPVTCGEDRITDSQPELIMCTDFEINSNSSETNDQETEDPLLRMTSPSLINEDQETEDDGNTDLQNEDQETKDDGNKDLQNEDQENVNVNNEDADKENVNIEHLLCDKDDFVLVKLTYNIESKKPTVKHFIAQIEKEEPHGFTCKFMRKSIKCDNTFIFPVIEDQMQVNKTEIVRRLLAPEIKRGRHIFNDIFLTIFKDNGGLIN